MKIWGLLIIMLFASATALAGKSGLFELDEVHIDQQMLPLTQLEQFLLQNGQPSINELKTQPNLLASLDYKVRDMVFSLNDVKPPLGIPSFIWGCVLNWVGMVITYIVTDSKAETRKALLGCVISGVGYAVIYFFYVLLNFG